MKHLMTSALLGWLTLLVWQPAPAAEDIAWARIPGDRTSALGPAQRAAVQTVLQESFSYYGCSQTLAACLKAERDNATARRMAAYVVRLALNGKSVPDMKTAVTDRARSAHPFKTQTFDLAGRPVKGDAQAPLKVVEFADFQCPFCAKTAPLLARLMTALPGKIQLYFWHFPVQSHPRAIPAALAAEAVFRHGNEAFWKFYDVLFAHRNLLEDDDLARHAVSVGADAALVSKALSDESLKKWIAESKLAGLKLKIRETPTLFVNGKQYFGSLDEDSLRDRFEEELDLLAGVK